MIRDFPQSSTLSPLRTFLGLVNFYHRFIPKCTAILTLLNALLKTTATNSRALQWTPPATTAFNDIKEALANATLLVHPKPNAPLNFMTDASNVAQPLEQSCSNFWMTSGVHYLISPENYHQQNSDTVHLTANSWPCIVQSATFDTFWKLVSSIYSPITNHLPTVCSQNQIGIHPVKYVTWTSFHNSLVTSDTWLEKVTQ